MTRAINDDFEKRVRCADYLRGFIAICHQVDIPLGPRRMVAGLRISYEGQYSLQFVSKVTWPIDSNYEEAVRRGILIALNERGQHSIGGKFTLDEVMIDEIHSCEAAFSLAATGLTVSILRLLKSHDEASRT